MRIDTDVIREVLYSIDPDAKSDPDFAETMDMVVSAMVRKQKDKDGEESNEAGDN